jgi:hypothetical protein
LFGEEMAFDYSIALFLLFAALLLILIFLFSRSLINTRKRKEKSKVETRLPNKVLKKVKDSAISEEMVKAVLIRRIEAIKSRDSNMLISLADSERYTKFDDWPPFIRQSIDALKREAEALKVLKEYDYETADWKISIFGEVALASFTIRYRGKIRNLKFDVHSRITAFLIRREGEWKLVHEHWSRFPNQT